MHRLFVALVPPPAVRDALLTAMGGLAGARWQRDDQLHLTLRFIGEVDRHRADDVAAALGGVRASSFTLRLATAGTFDRKGRIDTLWIGVAPHDEVRALHRRIETALRRVGIASDGRAFLPHVTVARLGRDAAPGAAAWVPRTDLAAVLWPVAGFALLESTLGHDGSDYRTIEHYR